MYQWAFCAAIVTFSEKLTCLDLPSLDFFNVSIEVACFLFTKVWSRKPSWKWRHLVMNVLSKPQVEANIPMVAAQTYLVW